MAYLPKKIVVTLPALIGLAVLLDQLTKWYFVSNQQQVTTLIEPYLYLEYHLNTQLALSLPLVGWLYYPVLAVVIITLSWQWYKAVRNTVFPDVYILSVVLVGAYSNLVDRFIHGGVVDFIAVSFWSIFNVADVYIVLGIIVWSFILWRRDTHAKEV